MSQTENDLRTPGRSAGARSTLAAQDLLRRLQRLPIPAEALPRLARFVEDEVAAALENAGKDSFSAAEVTAAGGDADLVAALRKRRAEAERVESLRRAGLSALAPEELERVLELARRK